MAAASCDGGDGENNVDSSLVGGVGGANACHYVVYCRTVYIPLAYRSVMLILVLKDALRTICEILVLQSQVLVLILVLVV